MRRVEIQLNPVAVEPLLVRLPALAAGLGDQPANPTVRGATGPETDDLWTSSLVERQSADVTALLALFDQDFRRTGVLVLTDENVEPVLRGAAALRLRLWETALAGLGDAVLEAGEVDPARLSPEGRTAYGTYLLLATLQEVAIEHLDPSERPEPDES